MKQKQKQTNYAPANAVRWKEYVEQQRLNVFMNVFNLLRKTTVGVISKAINIVKIWNTSVPSETLAEAIEKISLSFLIELRVLNEATEMWDEEVHTIGWEEWYPIKPSKVRRWAEM